MKVLQLTKFYPPIMGGIESVAYELTEGMLQRGHMVDVLCANTAPTTARERAPSGHAIVRAASFGKVLSTSMAPALLLETRRAALHQDVIHVHMPDPLAALALRLARPRARLVVHWHSDVVNQRRAMRLYEPLQRWLLQRADAIIATSPPYAASSLWLAPWQNKVHVIPIGISEPRADPTAVARVRQTLAGRRLVFALGRMTYYKGFDQLLAVAARLPDDAVIVVGGSGELLQGYRQAAQAGGVADRIRFVGRLSDADVVAHMAVADVFCLPSTARSEAFGVVLLEAMAMGKPVLSTDIVGSGVPWVNQHGTTGLTVPVGDLEALSQTLRSMLDDASRSAAFGNAGRARFLREFTAAHMVNRTIALYERLLLPSTTGTSKPLAPQVPSQAHS